MKASTKFVILVGGLTCLLVNGCAEPITRIVVLTPVRNSIRTSSDGSNAPGRSTKAKALAVCARVARSNGLEGTPSLYARPVNSLFGRQTSGPTISIVEKSQPDRLDIFVSGYGASEPSTRGRIASELTSELRRSLPEGSVSVNGETWTRF